jgi:putative ABC transport system permease protein
MQRILNDARFGARMLVKARSSALLVLVALSLGIGLSAVMFSMIDGAVLTKLPVAGGDRIVRIGREDRAAQTPDDYTTWSTRQRSFDALGAVAMNTVTLAIDSAGAEPVLGAAITPSILTLLSTQPAIGRPFTDADAALGAPAVVLVSDDVWRTRLGKEPNVVGRIIRVDGRPAEIVGVMPPGFGFPWDQQVWSPLGVDPLRPGGGFTTTGESRGIVGRLREGVTVKDAARELTEITRQLDREKGRALSLASAVHVSSFTDLLSAPGGSAALAGLMLGIAFLVLLVACSNVASVLLARAEARRQELAVRLALGASRLRITSQLLVETSLLAVAGAAGGLGLTVVGIRYVNAVMPNDMPYWIILRVDWPVLAFVALTAIVTTLMAGLMPALQASRANTHDVLREDARGASSFRLGRVMRRLVGVEIALSFVLLVMAGLFVRSASKYYATSFAFGPEEVYSAQVRLPEVKYADSAARGRFVEHVQEALGAMPQVAGVALGSDVPGIASSSVVPIELNGAEPGRADGPQARSIVATPGYFELFRSSVLAGRDFDARDRDGATPVAIVNESFAKRFFPKGAIDQRIRQTGTDGKGTWLTIIGVTTDLLEGGLHRDTPEAVYVPVGQHAQIGLTMVVRPRTTFATLPAPLRASMAALDPDVALFRVIRLETDIDDANSQYKWLGILFFVSGAIALFLAALGLYGVMAFWVSQRTREIGIRMAVGGQRSDIVRLVLRQAMTQTSIGLGVGCVLAGVVAKLLSSAFYDVAPYDPIVFGSVLAVLTGAGWLGCWLPARRATRIDPLKALVAK